MQPDQSNKLAFSENEYVTISKTQLQQLHQKVQTLENQIREIQLIKMTSNKKHRLQSCISQYQDGKFIYKRSPSDSYFTCKCNHENKKSNPSQQHVKELVSWSKHFKYNQTKDQPKVKIAKQQKLEKVIEQTQLMRVDKENEQKISLIEQICLFGPNQKEIIGQTQKNFSVSSKLYFPEHKQKFQRYSQIFFPEGIQVNKIRSSQTYKTIFKKAATRQEVAVITLMKQQQHPIFQQKQYKLLRESNPNHKLYAFVVYFNDTICAKSLQKQYHFSQSNLSDKHSIQYDPQDVEHQKQKKSSLQKEKTKQYTAQFCLVIFTYFPLVSLIQDIILSLLEQIKIRRLNYFTQVSNQLANIDINYIIGQIDQITGQLIKQLSQFHPQIGEHYFISINEMKIDINLNRQQIAKYMMGRWAPQIIKMLNKQLFYDILTAFMLQQSICIICQDIHFLTYFILLFQDFLIRPLQYPFKCITLSARQQYFGMPYGSIQGINKGNKWLQENMHLFSNEKIIINFNDKVTVKSKQKFKTIRSQPLKDIVRTLYKDIETLSDISYLFKVPKKQSLKKSSLEGQDKLIFDFLNKIKQYFEEQIIKHLPNLQIIQVLQNQTNQENKSKQAKNLLITIHKYLNESRKNKQKDEFLEKLFQKQAFELFLCQMYKI